MREHRPLLGCLAFTAAGVAILALDRSAEGRVIGLMTVLFFGGCALVLAAPLLSRPGGVRIVDAGAERGFLFPFGRGKQLVVVLACAAMAAAGVFVAASGAIGAGVLCVVAFAAFAAIAAVRLPRADRGLLLTPTRIVVSFNGRVELPWDEVAAVGLFGDRPARVLGISALHPERVPREHDGALAQLSRVLDPADITLPAAQLAGEPEHALRILTLYLEHAERRSGIGTAPELERISHAELR